MYYLNLKVSKSGHQVMQILIMLCLKAKGIHTAPSGNSYNIHRNKGYINFLNPKMGKRGEEKK